MCAVFFGCICFVLNCSLLTHWYYSFHLIRPPRVPLRPLGGHARGLDRRRAGLPGGVYINNKWRRKWFGGPSLLAMEWWCWSGVIMCKWCEVKMMTRQWNGTWNAWTSNGSDVRGLCLLFCLIIVYILFECLYLIKCVKWNKHQFSF